MIIRYPTGLYKDVIPQRPETAGNVTFTISNTTPPRSDLLFLKLPPAIATRPHEPLAHTDDVRRSAMGGLVTTVAVSSPDTLGTGMKQFEVGQVLEFETITHPTVQPMLVAPRLEVRHDTNVLDYTAIGLSEDETVILQQAGYAELQTLTDSLNELRKERSNHEIRIAENQKQINETTKAYNAINTILVGYSDDTLLALAERLANQLVELNVTKNALIETTNELAADASATLDRLRAVAQVVR